ncbi:MAG: response regulator, partial [Halobacteriota archaeon]
QVVVEAIRLNVKNYLNKPISLEELSACVSHAQERLIEETNNNEKHQILVVDDEKALADRIKQELEKEGYTVAVVYNGQDGLDYFERHRVDMLIVDVRMPAMDGLELIDRCQQINNDFTSIIITGHGDHEIARKALKKGVFDYLKKPLSLDKLITSVKKGIEHLNASRGKFCF